MAYKTTDIANKILAKGTASGDLISNLKLQKLLYYMQGVFLAYFDKQLFEDDIEAWMYGPVVPSIYHLYKDKGNLGIEYDKEVITLNSTQEENLFDEVFRIYSRFSATGLMEMTHNESPWKSVKTGVGNIISPEIMKQFFKKRIK